MRLIPLLLLLFAAASQALLPGNDPFLPVEQAFPFSNYQQGGQLRLDWATADQYYLYRDRLQVEPGPGVRLGELALPEGETYDDAEFGLTVIYRQPLSLQLPLLEVPAGGTVTITYQGCAAAGLCYPPVTEVVALQPLDTAHSGSAAAERAAATPVAPLPAVNAGDEPRLDFSQLLGSSNRLWALLLFLGAGLLLAFTPCVLPLLPILSAVLAGGGQLNWQRGLLLSTIYVQGMALTYAALGLLVAYFGLQLQAALQHPLLLGAVALLFVLLAASMFGLFTLQLPSRWQSKLQHGSQQLHPGRYRSALLLGILAGLVATPCTTAPLTGALIYVAQSGDLLLGAMALYLLALGMGLPLIAIGASGGKLLMRGGGWMNGVKRTFGYLLLAAALLIADRLLPGLFSRWLWLALVVVALADLLWPLGRNWRPLALLLKLVLAAVLLAGLQWQWQLLSVNKQAFSCAQRSEGQFCNVSLAELPAALAAAASAGQPVLVDLYADWCVACREFEQQTFPHPAVQAELARMVALRVDLTRIDGDASQFLARQQILGLPTLLLYGSDGQEKRELRATGFEDGPAFAARLQQLR